MWALRCKCGQHRPGDAEVSDAKRYKLINGLFQPRNLDDHARFSGEQRVVFASDYDALEADRDQWRNQARIGVECQFDEGKKYEARISQLEATLAARHKQLAVLWDVLARNERMFALANEAMAALAAPDAKDGSAVDRGGEP